MTRGIPFQAWTAAMAAAGVPVAPSEARELFRYLGLPLASAAEFASFKSGYAAIAGFRFLVTSGLMAPGADMYSVVVGAGGSAVGAADRSAASWASGGSGGGLLGSPGGGRATGHQDDEDAISDLSGDDRDEGEQKPAGSAPTSPLRMRDLGEGKGPG